MTAKIVPVLPTSSPSSSASRPFPSLGLTLKGIEKFIRDVGGMSVLKDLTTTEVCIKYVQPMTKQDQLSYCSYLQKKDCSSDIVGTANLFVSHAWRYKFLNVVDALRNCDYDNLFKETSESSGVTSNHQDHEVDLESGRKIVPVIWFDLFSNNQHGLEDPPPFEWWCETFAGAIRKMRRVVMVLEPWDNPISLTRVWCLWEVYCAVNTGSKLEIVMSHEEFNRFEQMILEDSSAFDDMIGKIDIQESQATNEKDKIAIFEVVEKTIGFGRLNSIVMTTLRDWVLMNLQRKCESLKSSVTPPNQQTIPDDKAASDASTTVPLTDYWSWVIAYIEVLAKQGKFSEAETLINETTSTFQTVKDEYLSLKWKLATANLKRLRYRDSYFFGERENEEILTSFQGREKHLHILTGREFRQIYDLLSECSRDYWVAPPPNVNLLIRLSLKGRLYRMEWQTHSDYMDEFDAESCLSDHKKEYGENHRETLLCMSYLARMYLFTGSFTNAVELYQTCYEKHCEVLGKNHPTTLQVLSDYGEVYHWLDETKKAVETIQTCLDQAIVKLGEDHNFVLQLKEQKYAYEASYFMYFYRRIYDKQNLPLLIKLSGLLNRIIEFFGKQINDVWRSIPPGSGDFVSTMYFITIIILSAILIGVCALVTALSFVAVVFFVLILLISHTVPVWIRKLLFGWLSMERRCVLYQRLGFTRLQGRKWRSILPRLLFFKGC